MKKFFIILFIVVIIFLSYAIFNPFLKLNIKGGNYELNVNSEYKENGYKARSLFVDLTKNVKVIGKVNTKKLGKYKLEYKIDYLLKSKKVYRQIKVVDKEKPSITLLGNKNIEIYTATKYKESGYTAYDNYDKDITKKVLVNSNLDINKPGDYEIKYSVTDSSGNKNMVVRNIKVKEKIKNDYSNIISSTPKYINGILIVNKTYALPSNYAPGIDATASKALSQLQSSAAKLGYNIPLLSGFRSYETQRILYNNYVARDGVIIADTYSARPGHSEHQTGLAFDVGKIDNNYGNTKEGKWLRENCANYGFILRYLKGKENITGYMYEPWHIRYVGIDVAKEIMQKNITLEEYLNLA